MNKTSIIKTKESKMLTIIRNFFTFIHKFRIFGKTIAIEDSTIGFLLLIWLINPSNKLILLFFFVLLLLFIAQTKDVLFSLFSVFLISSFFSVGKTYFYTIDSLYKYPILRKMYPLGLGSAVQITFADVIFVFAITYLVYLLFTNKMYVVIKKIDVFLLLFVFISIISDITVSKNKLYSLYQEKIIIEYVFFYFIVKTIPEKKEKREKTIKIVSRIVFFQIFIGLLQYLYGSPIGRSIEATHSIVLFGSAPDELLYVFRPIGTFFHSNQLAMFLITVYPLMAYLYMKKRSFENTVIFFSTGFLLALTLSRSSWLSLLIQVVIYFVFRREKRFGRIPIIKRGRKYSILFFGIILFTFLHVFPRMSKIDLVFEKGGGAMVRLEQTKEVLELIFQHPFLGVGKGMTVKTIMDDNIKSIFVGFPSDIHNYYLLQIAENGLPSIMVLMFFLLLRMRMLFSFRSGISFFIFLSYVGVVVNSFFQPFTFLFFLIMITEPSLDTI